MTSRIAIDQEELRRFCFRWKLDELSLFGSVLRDDFRPDSDIDVLIHFHPEARPTLFDLVTMKGELEELFGRRIDLVTRQEIERNQNPIRREAILDTAERIV